MRLLRRTKVGMRPPKLGHASRSAALATRPALPESTLVTSQDMTPFAAPKKMKLVALILFMVAASVCGAADVATQLEVARIDYDLPALKKQPDTESFAFRIFIQPALSDRGYAVDGTLTIPRVGEAGGSLKLVERTSREPMSRAFTLTHLQAREVYCWFRRRLFSIRRSARLSIRRYLMAMRC